MSHDFATSRSTFSDGWCNDPDCYAHIDSPARCARPCPLPLADAWPIEPHSAISERWNSRQIKVAGDPITRIHAVLDAWDAGDIVTGTEAAEAIRDIVCAPSASVGNSADVGQS